MPTTINQSKISGNHGNVYFGEPPRNNSPQAIGLINDEATWANLNDFTVVGNGVPQINLNSGKITMSGGTGGSIFTNYIQFTKSGNPYTTHCLEKWTQRVTCKTPTTLDGTTFGFGLGVRTVNANQVTSTSMRWAWDGSGYLFYLYVANSTTGQIVSSTGYTPTANTTYVLEVTRLKANLTVTVFASDGTTQLFQTTLASIVVNPANSQVMHNTGKFTIENFGGKFDITEWKITSVAQKYVDYLNIGDSNMYGLYCTYTGGTYPTDRYVEKAMTASGRTFEICAGFGDKTGDVLAAIECYKALLPTNVYLNIGSNDIAYSISTGTWQSNIDSIISGLTSVGITVKLGTPVARNIDLTAVQTYINGKANTKIDVFNLTKNGTALLAAYSSPDGVHMNLAGNNACATLLETII